MIRPWFDNHNALMFDRYVAELPSFRSAIADETISTEELTQQSERVAGLFKQLEKALDSHQKDIATDALCELAVLHVMHELRQQQADAADLVAKEEGNGHIHERDDI